MLQYIITDNSLTVMLNGIPQIVDNTHQNFEEIKKGIKDNIDEETLLDLIDVSIALTKYSEGRVKVEDGTVYYKNTPIRNTLTTRILTMMEEGFNVDGMCKFMDNLYNNPSKTAVDELYLFLEACNLPITEDGHFLAYKKVRNDYKDIHSGTFDNSIGRICQMERNQVDDKRENTCSQGLHFASYSYMKSFGNTGVSDGGDRIVIVKINPADVVSIPSDYNNAKGRAWRYEVVNEVLNDGKTQIKSDCITNVEAYHDSLQGNSQHKETISETNNLRGELNVFIRDSFNNNTLTVENLLMAIEDWDDEIYDTINEKVKEDNLGESEIIDEIVDELEYICQSDIEDLYDNIKKVSSKITIKDTNVDLNINQIDKLRHLISDIKSGTKNWDIVRNYSVVTNDMERFNDYKALEKALEKSIISGDIKL